MSPVAPNVVAAFLLHRCRPSLLPPIAPHRLVAACHSSLLSLLPPYLRIQRYRFFSLVAPPLPLFPAVVASSLPTNPALSFLLPPALAQPLPRQTPLLSRCRSPRRTPLPPSSFPLRDQRLQSAATPAAITLYSSSVQPCKPPLASPLLPLLPTACRHCQPSMTTAALFLPPLPATALIAPSALLPADPALSFLLPPTLSSCPYPTSASTVAAAPFIIFILQPPSLTAYCCHLAKLQQPSCRGWLEPPGLHRSLDLFEIKKGQRIRCGRSGWYHRKMQRGIVHWMKRVAAALKRWWQGRQSAAAGDGEGCSRGASLSDGGDGLWWRVKKVDYNSSRKQRSDNVGSRECSGSGGRERCGSGRGHGLQEIGSGEEEEPSTSFTTNKAEERHGGSRQRRLRIAVGGEPLLLRLRLRREIENNVVDFC
ncbi:hypothetical protein B296_00039498 [Ensete ventricosum]|uniref:Uncharacterized protein n=1 Tax=Ensete ventricosum TaxID=4639 RepID=A0A426Y7P2_ENSVE|nr:hypothetical protein B296_00039498 [Ensete ventricosum]